MFGYIILYYIYRITYSTLHTPHLVKTKYRVMIRKISSLREGFYDILRLNKMFDFGTRPLQKRGPTLSLNLPRVWARSEGVDRGDLIQILMTDEGFLLLAPANRLEIMKSGIPGEGKQAPTSTPTPGPGRRPQTEAMPGD